MAYIYVLYSEKDGKKYTGLTNNMDERLREHKEGKVQSTAWRRPLSLLYYEWCADIRDAVRREKYLKTYYGKSFIKKRVRNGLAKYVSTSKHGTGTSENGR